MPPTHSGLARGSSIYSMNIQKKKAGPDDRPGPVSKLLSSDSTRCVPFDRKHLGDWWRRHLLLALSQWTYTRYRTSPWCLGFSQACRGRGGSVLTEVCRVASSLVWLSLAPCTNLWGMTLVFCFLGRSPIDYFSYQPLFWSSGAAPRLHVFTLSTRVEALLSKYAMVDTNACPKTWISKFKISSFFVKLIHQTSLTRVTKSYLSALGTTQISSYITKHWTKFLIHQTGNYPMSNTICTCFPPKF